MLKSFRFSVLLPGISSADNTPYEKIGNAEPVSIADEVPFEIPESWEWVRVKSCTEFYNGRAFKPSDWTPDGLPIVRIQNLNDRNAPFNRYNQNVDKYVHLHGGELLFAWSGTPGTSFGAHIWDRGEAVLNQHIFNLLFSEECLYKPYYMYALNERVGSLINAAHGSAGLQHVTRGVFEATLIPLPPYKEQIRIVDKLHEIEPLIQQYGLAYDAAQKKNSAFPEQLKKSILQLAVQGKLVPQDPSDEPASVLLERIRAEKERLIAEGKIKRDKHESVIYRRDNSHYEKRGKTEVCIDAEIPFDIPGSWRWCRLRTICYDMRYGTAKKSLKTGEVAVLRMGNIQHGEIDYSNLVYSDDPDDNNLLMLQNKDILFNRTNSRELVGKTGIYRGNVPAIYAGYLVLIRPIMIDPEYINYVMNSQYEWLYCQNVRSDGINQANVSASKIGEFLVPIPPLKEQMRIVQMLIKVLPLTSNRK